MRLFPLLTITLIVFAACSGKKGNGTSTEQPASAAQNSLPFLSNLEISKLYAMSQKVDIIFYNLPISVSQDDEESAKNTVLYITPASPANMGSCKAIGRLSWISEGKIVREADFYLGDNCHYLVFMEHNQPVFANDMGKEGVEFFTNIMNQAKAKLPQ
ncbi:MAG TPA: hypothetical protein VJ508_16670 [Saprospiraceae bacterium]|nr:hypothetical protein [Saprospiraceae bacterium]